MKIKPFIRWAGGKQNLVDEIMSNMPDCFLINKYFEPFLGAGSIFFANDFKNAIISDINPQLINAYSFLKLDYLKVYNLLQEYTSNFENNFRFYYKLRSLFNSDKNKYDYIQAARFIFLIHANYNGMYRVNKKGDYNVPIGKLKPNIPNISQMKLINEKLKDATIKCGNYKKIVCDIGKNDFIYIDPPYPPVNWLNPQNQFTINNFTKKDHESLAAFVNELIKTGCFVLISYPDIEFIKNLYKNWEIVKIETYRSISCKKERKKISELLIKNY